MKQTIFAFLTLCVVVGISLPAQATLVNRDQANEYYATCISRKAPGVRIESLSALCACTSANLMSKMTAEELALVNAGTGEGRAASNKMLLEVYAPCTEVVAADMLDFQCVNNKKLDELNQGFDMPKVCACAAQKGADWYKGKAKILMEDILNKNPNVTDPVGALMVHPMMKSQISGNLIACSASPAPEKAAPAAQ